VNKAAPAACQAYLETNATVADGSLPENQMATEKKYYDYSNRKISRSICNMLLKKLKGGTKRVVLRENTAENRAATL